MDEIRYADLYQIQFLDLTFLPFQNKSGFVCLFVYLACWQQQQNWRSGCETPNLIDLISNQIDEIVIKLLMAY